MKQPPLLLHLLLLTLLVACVTGCGDDASYALDPTPTATPTALERLAEQAAEPYMQPIIGRQIFDSVKVNTQQQAGGSTLVVRAALDWQECRLQVLDLQDGLPPNFTDVAEQVFDYLGEFFALHPDVARVELWLYAQTTWVAHVEVSSAKATQITWDGPLRINLILQAWSQYDVAQMNLHLTDQACRG